MFYDQLKKACDEQKVKMTPIVIECGGAKGSISNWRKGASPNSDIVLKLAQRLGVSTDYLLGNTPGQSAINNNSGNNYGVIGNNYTNMSDGTTEYEKELLRIFRKADIKKRMQIMNYAYEVEEGNNAVHTKLHL